MATTVVITQSIYPTFHWTCQASNSAPKPTQASSKSPWSTNGEYHYSPATPRYINPDFHQVKRNRLPKGETLHRNSSLSSPSGKYKCYLSDTGALTISNTHNDYKQQVAPSRRAKVAAEALKLQKDGNLVLLDARGQLIWSSRTALKTADATGELSLVLQDDGFLVLESSSGPLWASSQDFWRSWIEL